MMDQLTFQLRAQNLKELVEQAEAKARELTVPSMEPHFRRAEIHGTAGIAVDGEFMYDLVSISG
jgi:hypothetical protein